jgi:hypothetical protein
MNPIILDIGNVVPCFVAEEVADCIPLIPESAFTRYEDPDFEFGKRAMNDFGKMPWPLWELLDTLQSSHFIRRVEKWTGIQGLIADRKLWGGGVHVTEKGGYLAMHRDFNVLPTSYRDPVPMRRAVNLIMYLTPNWDRGWGGELEIAESLDGGVMRTRKVEPWFGSAVLFDPSQVFHGHPHPYQGATPRQSVAVYYYVREAVPMDQWRSTEYLSLPWKKDTLEAQKKRMERAFARLRYAKWWPESFDANGSPV